MATDESGAAPEATAADPAEMDEESSSDSDSDIESDEEQKDSEKVRAKGLESSWVSKHGVGVLHMVVCSQF